MIIKKGTFEPGANYLFVCNQRVFGVFNCQKWSRTGYLFKHSKEHSMYYFQTKKSGQFKHIRSSESTKIISLFKNHQRQEQTLILKITEDKLKFEFVWHALCLPELIRSYSVKKTKEILNLQNSLSELLETQNANSTLFERTAKRLSQFLFEHELSQVLQDRPLILAVNNSSLNPNLLHDGIGYLGQRAKLINYCRGSTRRKKKLFTILNSRYKTDFEMEKEFNSLEKLFAIKQEIKMEAITANLSIAETADLFERSELLHYIGHGENGKKDRGMVLAENTYFNTKELSRLRSVPRILIVSCCNFIDNGFISTYFQRGGEALIFFQGLVRSAGLTTLFKSFYWQLINKHNTIAAALYSAKKKPSEDEATWAFLSYYGTADISLNF